MGKNSIGGPISSAPSPPVVSRHDGQEKYVEGHPPWREFLIDLSKHLQEHLSNQLRQQDQAYRSQLHVAAETFYERHIQALEKICCRDPACSSQVVKQGQS